MTDVAEKTLPLSMSSLIAMVETRDEAVSHDGALLACLSNASGTHQVRLRDLAHGTLRQLTDMPDRIGAIAFSPVSRDLLFTMDCGGDERHQLWLIAGAAGAPQPLTQDLTTLHAWGCWSPDGQHIAYSCNARDKSAMDVMVMAPETRVARCVVRGTGWCDVLCFTPDGQGLLVRGSDRGTMDQDLWLVDIGSGKRRMLMGPGDGGGASAILSARFTPGGTEILVLCDRAEGFHAVHCLDPEGGGLARVAHVPEQDIERFALAASTGALAFTSNDRGYSRLFLRDRIDGPEREIALPAAGVITSLRFLPDGSALVLSFETAQRPAVVMRYDPEAQHFSLLAGEGVTDSTSDALVAPEVVTFTSFDGTKVPAFVYRPQDPLPNLPVLFIVHGGPEAQWRPGWRADLQHYLVCGIMVIAPNVRGSTGYGRTYHQMDDRERREDAVRDLCAMAEAVGAWPEVDKTRIGAMGQSYGGYMILAALALRPDLWKTGVDFYGVADFITLMRTTGPWRRALRAAEYGAPETMAAFLTDISPVNHLARIAAPLLLVHATEDPRVPMEQSEQVFAILRGLGHPVEFLRLTGEGHGFARLENRIAAYSRVARFLKQTL
ncbi:S9 family peptidase [Pararhodobacter sp.]|uniref:S9 family peptidase n=1 Tax=Pararhodobacter sp. TaxID=2127056 RepID=UPI002FDEE2B2